LRFLLVPASLPRPLPKKLHWYIISLSVPCFPNFLLTSLPGPPPPRRLPLVLPCRTKSKPVFFFSSTSESSLLPRSPEGRPFQGCSFLGMQPPFQATPFEHSKAFFPPPDDPSMALSSGSTPFLLPSWGPEIFLFFLSFGGTLTLETGRVLVSAFFEKKHPPFIFPLFGTRGA